MKTGPEQHASAFWGTRFFAIAVVATISTGCAMCCGPFDYHYPTYGGRVQRADPEYGRVGSIFSDPYTAGSGPTADSNVVPPKLSNPNMTTQADSDQWAPEPQAQPTAEAPQPPQRKSLDEWRTRSTPTNWR